MGNCRRILAVLPLLLLPYAALHADSPATAEKMTPEQREANFQSALAAAKKSGIAGPAKQALLDQGELTVEQGMMFVPKSEGEALMRAAGNVVGPDFVGLIIAPDSDWVATIDFKADGYVKDDDAKDWKVDELFDNLRQGTEQANEQRRARGFGELELTGWIERPTYVAQNHSLVWSVGVRNKEKTTQPPTVNYNTYLLGRQGYFSIDFISSQAVIEQRKPLAHAILADTSFLPGKRYEDFSASTDKIAAYGLAALIGGIALKKLGLLALGAAFFLKFAKLILVSILAIGAGIKKFLTGKRRRAEQALQNGSPSE